MKGLKGTADRRHDYLSGHRQAEGKSAVYETKLVEGRLVKVITPEANARASKAAAEALKQFD